MYHIKTKLFRTTFGPFDNFNYAMVASYLLALLLLLLTCFMFAQVNVNCFCGDSCSLIDRGSTVYAEGY